MSPATSVLDRNELIQRMTKLLVRLEKRKQIHHVVLGMASIEDDWTWIEAVGSARPDGAPMRPDTPWFRASVTKLYIASVVLRLAEQGLIDLDVPINGSVPPELASGLHVYQGVDRTNEITPTHLLGHSTGLPDYLDERAKDGRSLVEEILEEDRAWRPDDAVRRCQLPNDQGHYGSTHRDAGGVAVALPSSPLGCDHRDSDHAVRFVLSEPGEQLAVDPGENATSKNG